MNRLHTEWRRLFGLDPAPQDRPASLFDEQGERTRTLVIEWGRPAHWPTLRALWEAVQVEFGWPAPLIALNGHDAFQLWISLADPVTAPEAHEVADALAERWLPRTPGPAGAGRLALWPRPGPQVGGAWQHAAPVPALQAGTASRWSAFVAPDLVAVFDDEASLDIDPGNEAQAELMTRCGRVSAASWARAQDALRLSAAIPARGGTGACGPAAAGVEASADTAPTPAASGLAPPDLGGPHDDPGAFLKAVMNATSVPLSLRIEAARALLSRSAPGPATP